MTNNQKRHHITGTPPPGTAGPLTGRAGAAAPPHLNEDAPPVTVSADPYQTSLARKPPIKAKTPAIKANRASSRQTLKNKMPSILQTTLPMECGSLPPLSRTLPRPKAAASRRTPKHLRRALTCAHQGKNPCNRASSSLIKANAVFPSRGGNASSPALRASSKALDVGRSRLGVGCSPMASFPLSIPPFVLPRAR